LINKEKQSKASMKKKKKDKAAKNVEKIKPLERRND
jgi:hypothetical protein